MVSKALVTLAAAQAVSAHFGLTYPPWRADSLSEENEAKYSQWTYPCAGVDYKAGNVTDWPLEGGALKLELHHPWAYVYVNLGLGENTTNFNISLTPELTNVTGKGTLCIDKLPVPIDVEDGTLASIQVVTGGASGSALYNCADIRFKKDAKKLDNCTSSEGIKVNTVKEGGGNSSSNSGNASTNGTASKEDKKSDGVVVAGSSIALMTVAGLVSAFALSL